MSSINQFFFGMIALGCVSMIPSMAILQSCSSVCLRESALLLPRRNVNNSYKSRSVKWRSPRGAVLPNFHLPMRSFEIKSRTSTDRGGSMLKAVWAAAQPKFLQ